MLTAFEVVARILVHLQGGKKKMKTDFQRNIKPSTVNHQFGRRRSSFMREASIIMKSFGRRSSMSVSMKSLERSSRRSSVSSPFSNHQYQDRKTTMQTTANPSLYHIPSEAYPEYRKIPRIIIFSIGMMAMICTYLIFDDEDISLVQHMPYTQYGYFLIISIFITIISLMIIQEWFYFPSRIPADTLIRKRWFPSRLSRFSSIDTEIPPELNHDESTSTDDADIKIDGIGVHFIECKNKSGGKDSKEGCDIVKKCRVDIDAIHLMHGFGASSLDWIHTIELLVENLGAKVAIAHDGVGFGFTNRPPIRFGITNDLAPYTSAGWAALGNSLILDRLRKDCRDDITADSSISPQKRVVLIGHSMGAPATLKMALTLPAYEKIVILVAPALVGTPPGHLSGDVNQKQKSNMLIALMKSIIVTVGVCYTCFEKIVVDRVLKYLLARGIGTPGFWLLLIQQMGGFTPSDEKLLALQWPSIAFGWEEGLLAFAKSRVLSACPYNGGELDLLDDVLMLPEVSLVIIHGTKDPLVPISISQDIVEGAIANVKIIEMEGAGHVPMVEKPEEFVDLIKTNIDEILAEKEDYLNFINEESDY